MKYIVTSKSFIDTNLWIYAFIEEENSKEKRSKIISLLRNLKKITISIQVVNEFHWILQKKYKIQDKVINDIITTGISTVSAITLLGFEHYCRAYEIRLKYALSFWDSLIVASAIETNCSILYSEDMQHKQEIDNKLIILNPFAD